jgi:hypothetical protein
VVVLRRLHDGDARVAEHALSVRECLVFTTRQTSENVPSIIHRLGSDQRRDS